MSLPRQGEIWWAEAVGVLRGIIVSPVTRTVRNIRTEIGLGSDEGMTVECTASFDNLQRVRREALTKKAGDLGIRRNEICVALRALADC